MKKILFTEMNDSFENFLICPLDFAIGRRTTNKSNELKIINPIKASKYKPLSGSLAKE